jgi:L-lactate dehydrogenase complex protein LldE
MTRPRVGLFVTCLVDLMRPNVGFAAIKLLESAGCEVIIPDTQTCCGQPAWNEGARKHAADMARAVIDAFETFDYVVAPSGSCAGMLKIHYPALLKDDPGYAARASVMSGRVHELTEFLVRVRGMKKLNTPSCATTACYHDSCSSLREMQVKTEPRALLSNVSGLDMKPLSEPERCCGFGGLFAIKYPEISQKMADDKIAEIEEAGGKLLIGGDLGCLLHLQGRMARKGKQIEVRHVAEVLAGDET